MRSRRSGNVRIAVAGAGLIGRRHAEAILAARGVSLAGIVDPVEAARGYAEGLGTRWYSTLSGLFEAGVADGVILATPNQVHVENGLACVAAGMPAIVEKPLAVDVAGARGAGGSRSTRPPCRSASRTR